MAALFERLDAEIVRLFDGWNFVSNAVLIAVITLAVWAVYDQKDADAHPLVLARQSQPSKVRQPRESAVYRSSEVPHGLALRTGLNVRPPGAPMYSAGRDGDLRHIWKRVTGEIPLDRNSNPGGKAKIKTVLGRQEIVDHDTGELSKEIAIIGKHLKHHGATRVAVYLPNSVELLATLFAGAFYGFTVILIPYNQPHPTLVQLLAETRADALVAEAGAVPLHDIARNAAGVRQVIWSVEKTSRHMDWNEVPEGIGGNIDVSVWHQLIQDHKSTAPTLLELDDKVVPPGVVFLWQDGTKKPADIIEFSQQNLAAATGALMSCLPRGQGFAPTDTFLPADLLTSSYPLCLTLAALFNQSTVLLNSVAGPGIDLSAATRNIEPTITVIAAETAAALHTTASAAFTSPPHQLWRYLASRDFGRGRMPAGPVLSALSSLAPKPTTPKSLRLVFISERAGQDACPPLSEVEMQDLRIYLQARIAYALTAPRVAGAVAVTSPYDYRIPAHGARRTQHSHFGIPLSCLELKLVDSGDHRTTDQRAEGEVVVAGPSVAGAQGEARLGINGMINDDRTLAYA